MHKSQLHVKSPCQEPWEDMHGSKTRRHCERCDRDVHNLSAMTRREADAVIARRAAGERVCVRYTVDDDGQVEFRREPLIPAQLLLRGRQVAMGASLMASAMLGCAPAGTAVGSASSHYAAEGLGSIGLCAISFEPILPFTLKLNAAACDPPAPEVMGQMEVVVPVSPTTPTAPTGSDEQPQSLPPAAPPPSNPLDGDPSTGADTESTAAAPARKNRREHERKRDKATPRPVPMPIQGDLG